MGNEKVYGSEILQYFYANDNKVCIKFRKIIKKIGAHSFNWQNGGLLIRDFGFDPQCAHRFYLFLLYVNGVVV